MCIHLVQHPVFEGIYISILCIVTPLLLTKVQVQEVNEELQAAKEFAKAARCREKSLKEEVDGLNQDLQKSLKTQRRLQAEKEEKEQEVQELKQQVKRLSSTLQVSIHEGQSKG